MAEIIKYTGDAECPTCWAVFGLIEVIKNEIVQCPECGTDLEIRTINPTTLDLAPETEEDYGE